MTANASTSPPATSAVGPPPFPAETGDVLFFEPYDWVGRRIASIDDASIGGLPISHAAFFAGVNPERVIDVGHEHGLSCQNLADVRNPNNGVARRVAVVGHPAGTEAYGWAAGVTTETVPYDLEHLMAAGLAALIRGLGAWNSPMFLELWERIHLYSRNLNTPEPCSCAQLGNCPVHHLTAHDNSRHWFCASFVDHAFRASTNCLQVREVHHRPTWTALVELLDDLVWLARLRGAGVEQIRGFRVASTDDGEPGDAPDGEPDTASAPDVPALAFDESTYDGVFEALWSACRNVYRNLTNAWRKRQQLERLVREFFAAASGVTWRVFGPQRNDGHRAPRQGEVAWGPLMSLRLLTDNMLQAWPTTVEIVR